MSGKCGINKHIVAQKNRRQPLEIRVGLWLMGKYRNRPMALLRHDGFVIPVGALYQAHGDPAPLSLCPADNIPPILFAVPVVSFERDSVSLCGGKFGPPKEAI